MTLHVFMTLHILISLNSFALLHILMTLQYIMTLHILMTFFAFNYALLLLLKPSSSFFLFFLIPNYPLNVLLFFNFLNLLFLDRICRILSKITECNPFIFPIYSIKPNQLTIPILN